MINKNENMKIMYMGVHYDGNENNWRSEYWINTSFKKNKVDTIKIDFRKILKESGRKKLKEIINEKSIEVDLIFLQRGDSLSPDLFSDIKIPIIFWSTEPINLKNDVDDLLRSNIFSWVYLHTYSCLNRIKSEFSHLKGYASVIHNGIGEDLIDNTNFNRRNFAIFNRNLSLRRRWWLFPSRKYVKIITGNYGEMYYKDLKESLISINIHFSSKNLDDFETGIFEAMASGCVVLSEKLDNNTLEDLNMKEAIIQVNSKYELKEKLKELKNNPDIVAEFQKKSNLAIYKNTWSERVIIFKKKFKEILKLK